ncbi:zinc-ribbon domain-containing protein [uncultured Enterovirga sp.]|uniref:zinc-ribbon domain-containing protein n=1 Tax=uncultured Enterovirga sp. TaxID=2026352 RepID=UPI0035C99029
MLISCPSCASEYTLDPERIGPIGRKVRCAACRESWFIVPEPDVVPPEEQIRVVRAQDSEPDIAPPPATEIAVPDGMALVIEPDTTISTAQRKRSAKPAHRSQLAGRRRSSGRKGPAIRSTWMRGAALALLLLAALPAAILARAAIVAALPGTAIVFSALGLPVNLVGLRFDGVASTLTQEGGTPVLVVTGEIVNVAGRDKAVPPIEVVVEGEAGEVLYAWAVEPSAGELAGAAKIPFRARLASPPPAGKRILVTFRESGLSKVALR